jgi:hypothetical protein
MQTLYVNRQDVLNHLKKLYHGGGGKSIAIAAPCVYPL